MKSAKRQAIDIGLAAGCALALCFSGLLGAAPQSLDDTALASVTAGSESGGRGIVTGNASSGTLRQSLELDLAGDAQQAAAGLNIINSQDAAVANTLNIWDGRTNFDDANLGGIAPRLQVNQVNEIMQATAAGGRLSGYLREGGDTRNSFSRSDFSSSAQSLTDLHQWRNFREEWVSSANGSASEINTRTAFSIGDKFSFEGHLGQGMAGAGTIDVEFSAGSADIAVSIGGGISSGVDTAGLTRPIEFLGSSLGDSGFAAGIDIDARIDFLTQIDLPQLSLHIDGAGCGVVMGSCAASATSMTSSHTISDQMSLDLLEDKRASLDWFNESSESVTRSAFAIGEASATYIIVDESDLEIETESRLELDDSAQAAARALNLVNAVGSHVANAVNLTRALDFQGRGSALLLNQFNSVRHGN